MMNRTRFFTTTLIALFSLLFASTALAQDAQVIGIVDLQRALNEVEAGQSARASLEADFERRQEELNAAQAELEEYAAELEGSLPMLTQEAAMERYQEYQNRLMALQQSFAEHQQELAIAEAEATEQIFENMVVIVEGIATERGLTLVLDKSTVVYTADGMEITDELIERYDAQY